MSDKKESTPEQGKSLWNSGSTADPSQTEMAAGKSAADRLAAKALRAEKADAKKAAAKSKSTATRAKLAKPFIAFSSAAKSNPGKTWSIVGAATFVVGFGALQVVNLTSASPNATIERYVAAINDADLDEIDTLEAAAGESTDWAPADVLDETVFPEVKNMSLDWSPLEASATATLQLDGVDEAVDFELTRKTTFGILGWTYEWQIVSDPVVVTFAIAEDMRDDQDLVVGKLSIGKPDSDVVHELTSKAFRALPGILSVGVTPNGYYGGPTEARQLQPGDTATLTFVAGGVDQALLESATEIAADAVLAQFNDCLDTDCNLLDDSIDDYAFSWNNGDAPEYWESEDKVDSYSNASCEILTGPKLKGTTVANFVYYCSYDISRSATRDLGDGVSLSDVGSSYDYRHFTIKVTADETGSGLTPGNIKYIYLPLD